jgi:glucosamine 6-phosphate synthetase-like amidotransferase/phosphosugar isomerase protein
MNETNSTPCEGLHVEQFLRGPVAGLSDAMALWVIELPGPSYARGLDVVKAANATSPRPPRRRSPAGGARSVDPLLSVIPLQWLSDYAALAKGTNPDTFHLDDPRHRQAEAHYSL